MAYTKYNADWLDYPSTGTPITQAALEHIETGVYDSHVTADAAVAKSLVDAKGDIFAGTASDTVARLAVGSNAQVLTADSTQSTGVKWATPASGSYVSGELLLVQVTSPLTVTGYDTSTAQTFVTATSYTFDGSTAVDVQLFCPRIQPAANDFITSEIWDNGVALAILNVTGMAGGGGTGAGGLIGSIRLTPSAAAHVYTWRVYRSGANGTMQAGTGASGGYAPASIRVVKA